MRYSNFDRDDKSVAPSIAAFTICATNYLPQARVLAASLAEHHPGLRLTVILLDDGEGTAAGDAALDTIPAAAVLSRRSWTHKRCHYDLLELATSIKPECFLHLLAYHDAVFYFDPDIMVLSPLPAIEAWPVDAPSAVLTPHVLTPLPDDGRKPDNLNILRAGQYNLGFAAFQRCPEALAFLEWWAGALDRFCLADPATGVFTDQKWVNFATSFMPRLRVDRDPGCNVAYWNLHERVPERGADGWRVRLPDGTAHALRFFHYRGFSPDRKAISRHEDRFRDTPPGEAAALFDAYANALRGAGFGRGPAAPPPVPRLADGTPWDPILRDLYRAALDAGLDLGDPLADPAFLDWACAVADGDQIARYARAVLRRRPDVAAAYQDGRDRAGLMRWLRTSGVTDYGSGPAILDRIGAAISVPGVHYVSYLCAHLGIAEAARGNIAALREAGVAVRTHDISDLAGSPTGTYRTEDGNVPEAGPPVAILGVNADALPGVMHRLPQAAAAAYRIGCWYWETPDFPDAWCDRFDLVDEVWAATEFVAQAIRAKATVPVVVMPPMVRPPAVGTDRPWVLSLVPDAQAGEFLFLFQFDVASVPFRKNPEGTIEAFTRAFTPHEPVRLIIKLLNKDQDPGLMTRLRGLAAGHRVSFLDMPLESLDRYRLIASIDCFVSLHRAEGFALSIAEAMAYGVPVVTTGWSGNADFTSPANAAIVAHDLRPTRDRHGPYRQGTVWAEPRLDDAARQMRRIVDDPAWRERIGAAGAATIRSQLSAEAVGAAMRARLMRIAVSARLTTRTAGRGGGGGGHERGRHHRGHVRLRGGLPAVARDVLRYPGYYISRLPRMPPMLSRLGAKGVLERSVAALTEVAPSYKKQFSLGKELRRLLTRLGSVGGGR